MNKGKNKHKITINYKYRTLGGKMAFTYVFQNYLPLDNTLLFTDNNPLTYIYTTKKLLALEQWCISILASFNMDIQFKPGKTNTNAMHHTVGELFP